MGQSPREKLGNELLALDRWGDFDPSRSRHATHPLDLLGNVGVPENHFDIYLPVLLRALDEPAPDTVRSIVWLLRNLRKKDIAAATGKLIHLYFEESLREDHRLLWDVGLTIYNIAPRDYLDECISICRDQRLGDSRHKLIVHLSRYKKSEKAFQTLISLLDEEVDEDRRFVRGAALEALKRFGDVRAIPAIERTPVRSGADGIYESHQKMMALKKLNEKLGKI